MSKPRIIAFYLPQFYPTKENDEWWGKGFTEWTNVGKAKPLFRGHYQPKVPGELGYYDLRIPEVRQAQAQLAKEAGIYGFSYWHYWFNGRRLLDRPFREVFESGEPDFPFCLTWANHSWKSKTWLNDGNDKMLIEQTYPGDDDYIKHFNELLPVFKDKRYIYVENKPIFGIFAPYDIPDPTHLIELWNDLAKENGLDGIYFVAYIVNENEINKYLNIGFNAVTVDYLLTALMNERNFLVKTYQRLQRKIMSIPKHMHYSKYVKYLVSKLPIQDNVFPCILPNFDHSPRSKERARVLTHSTPRNWRKLVNLVLKKVEDKNPETNIIFIKAWNEWAEGNYLEPDLKYGKSYLDVIKEEIGYIK